MYNERVSDRNQILVWLGLFGLLIPAYAIYAVCGARSVSCLSLAPCHPHEKD